MSAPAEKTKEPRNNAKRAKSTTEKGGHLHPFFR